MCKLQSITVGSRAWYPTVSPSGCGVPTFSSGCLPYSRQLMNDEAICRIHFARVPFLTYKINRNSTSLLGSTHPLVGVHWVRVICCAAEWDVSWMLCFSLIVIMKIMCKDLYPPTPDLLLQLLCAFCKFNIQIYEYVTLFKNTNKHIVKISCFFLFIQFLTFHVSIQIYITVTLVF